MAICFVESKRRKKTEVVHIFTSAGVGFGGHCEIVT
jgi:hypothetical protein